ncbi:class I histocompatibility antigen, F10 alpha chain-like [Pyxicephalus adspersus]|uniref:class I histocompatibility antigen, F10 alpha chain-like n=1 Tax=Pyxicephalus adspersus TaxID=30357 RepID=UPI003B5B7D00
MVKRPCKHHTQNVSFFADSHTLRYYSTWVTETSSGLPEFSVVAYVDDKEIHQYNSDTGKIHSIAPWMKKEGNEYWKERLWSAHYFQPVFRSTVRVVMKRFNQTGGFHSGQWMCGCELRDDGSIVGYSQMGYDGRDVVFLDRERGIYIPIVHELQLTTQEWNSPEVGWGKAMKHYLENICGEVIKKFVQHGREDLERRVRPEVKVWGRLRSDKVTRLHCLVYGFHPRAVDVKWMRNGVDHIPSDEMTPILPHPDGTYQIRVSVEVPKGEEDTFSCHVEHSSLGDENISVKWDPDNGLSVAVIAVIVCIVVILIVALGFGIVLFKIFTRMRLHCDKGRLDNKAYIKGLETSFITFYAGLNHCFKLNTAKQYQQ